MITEAIKELMNRYNEAKAVWIEKLGDNFDEDAFHVWFTQQVTG